MSIISEVSRTTFENVYKVIETVSVSWVVASGIANILEGQIAPSSSDGRGNKTDLITDPMTIRRLARKREKIVTLKEVMTQLVSKRSPKRWPMTLKRLQRFNAVQKLKTT